MSSEPLKSPNAQCADRRRSVVNNLYVYVYVLYIIHIVRRGVTASVVVNHLYIIQPLSFCLLPPPLHAIGLFHITINFHTSQNWGLKDLTDKTISLTVSTYLIAFSFNLCKKYFLEAQTIVNDGLMVVGDNVQDDLLQTTVKDGLVAEQNRRRNRCALF